MEVQVDFLGIDAALKLVPIWQLFSHDGFCTESKFFIMKVKPHLYTHFLNRIPFCKSIACMSFIIFSIAKGLAMCLLGGVIRPKKLYFESYLR